jgi:hypothetical protein
MVVSSIFVVVVSCLNVSCTSNPTQIPYHGSGAARCRILPFPALHEAGRTLKEAKKMKKEGKMKAITSYFKNRVAFYFQFVFYYENYKRYGFLMYLVWKARWS